MENIDKTHRKCYIYTHVYNIKVKRLWSAYNFNDKTSKEWTNRVNLVLHLERKMMEKRKREHL